MKKLINEFMETKMTQLNTKHLIEFSDITDQSTRENIIKQYAGKPDLQFMEVNKNAAGNFFITVCLKSKEIDSCEHSTSTSKPQG